MRALRSIVGELLHYIFQSLMKTSIAKSFGGIYVGKTFFDGSLHVVWDIHVASFFYNNISKTECHLWHFSSNLRLDCSSLSVPCVGC